MAAAWARSASVGGRSGRMRGDAGEVRKLLLGVPFDEQRNEVADRCVIEAVVNRPNHFVHSVLRHLWKPGQQAIDDLPDQSILFGTDHHAHNLAPPWVVPTTGMNEMQPAS